MAATEFVGNASACAIRLLLGNAVSEGDFALREAGPFSLMGDISGAQQLVQLTGIWFDWAARDGRVLAPR